MDNKIIKGDCYTANGSAFCFSIRQGKFPEDIKIKWMDVPENSKVITRNEFSNPKYLDDNGEFSFELLDADESREELPNPDTKEGLIKIMNGVKKWRLVHAHTINGEDNKPMGYSWIEGDDNLVFDFSNNPDSTKVLVNRCQFYDVWQIPPENHPKPWMGIENQFIIYKYTFEEVSKKVEESGSNMHWGPWDFEAVR